MALEVTGKVFAVLPSQTGQGQKGTWVKQAFVIETADQYPKKICFQAWGDKTEIVARLKTGDEVKVAVDLESREYQGKWYTDAKAWKIELVNQGSGSSSVKESAPNNSYDDAPPPAGDDLPF
ncbi:MAG: DUF3127 domain-containing protein [Chitinophagales bacterium]|nr:DUF3127 domain-containing protein [Chitinophagales bacterium]